MDVAFESRRSPVMARGGMVATSQPLAAQAGLEILRAGGTAADAAVATAAVLAVIEPTSTGIGGDCFALVFEAASGAVRAVNGSGRCPRGLSLEALQARGVGDRLPPFGPDAVTVPGTIAGWADTVARHGRLSLAEVLAPAIAYAEDGHPVAPVVAHFWARGAERLRSASPHGGALLIDGRAPRAGERFRNPGVASVLREVADGGAEAFYLGRPAREIVAVLAELGGALDSDDLARHRSTFEPPIHTRYRDHTIYECAPSGQGLAALLALNLLEGFELGALGPRSAERYHLMIEALRLAFADARRYVADPAQAEVPVEALLATDYSARRRALIDPRRATVDPTHGAPFASCDTVYLAAVDGEGNACSFINSNYMGFGTGIVPRGCGFSLQNRGAGFSLDPAHPNALAPGKRPYHTIIPAISTRPDGSLHACFGVMGGFMQPQGHVQVISGLLDHALDAQTTLDAPRFAIEPQTDSPAVHLEAPTPALLAELRARGHAIEPETGEGRLRWFGRGQVILRDASGTLQGGSDGRCDGAAVGY